MKICVIGSGGQLGLHLFHIFKKNKNFFFFSSSKKKRPFIIGNYNNFDNLKKNLNKIEPSVIINCSAFTNVDRAENDKTEARYINSKALKILSKYCYKKNITLIHFSTDYVYSGKGKKLWKESSVCKPVNFYGLTKLDGEKNIKRSKCKYIIIRLSWLYGEYGGSNFVLKLINLSIKKKNLSMVDDQYGSPTSTELVIFVLKKILFKIKKKKFNSGVFNLCSANYVNRFILSRYILNKYYNKINFRPLVIKKIKTKDLKLVAKRPLNSRMNNNKLSKYLNIKFKNWQYYMDRYINLIKKRKYAK